MQDAIIANNNNLPELKLSIARNTGPGSQASAPVVGQHAAHLSRGCTGNATWGFNASWGLTSAIPAATCLHRREARHACVQIVVVRAAHMW